MVLIAVSGYLMPFNRNPTPKINIRNSPNQKMKMRRTPLLRLELPNPTRIRKSPD
jgi:hypothetical protein